MINFHRDIMNIQIDEKIFEWENDEKSAFAYKIGHRDARHQAAEIALKMDRVLEEMRFIANQNDLTGNWAVELAKSVLKEIGDME